jgi:hypothetical protein
MNVKRPEKIQPEKEISRHNALVLVDRAEATGPRIEGSDIPIVPKVTEGAPADSEVRLEARRSVSLTWAKSTGSVGCTAT